MTKPICACDCELCQRSRKVRLAAGAMREKGLEKEAKFLIELEEMLSAEEFERNYIMAGMSHDYLSTAEVMKKFNIDPETMREFLAERRNKVNGEESEVIEDNSFWMQKAIKELVEKQGIEIKPQHKYRLINVTDTGEWIC